MFMSLFVIYGFDTASTLSEETRDPRRAAPKAVLYSIVGAFIIGGVFLLGTLMAIPNLHTRDHGVQRRGLGPRRTSSRLTSPTGFATLYLFVVSAAIFVCCLSIMAATIRLCFGMSRDNQLPFSKPLSKVAPKLHTPVWTCIAIAVLAAVPFLQYSGAGIIAIAATGMIYISYFLGNIAILRARARRLAEDQRPVPARRLGHRGQHPRADLRRRHADQLRLAASRPYNPKPNQTAGLLDFHIDFLNKIPILWTVFVFIVLVGAIYYLAVGRNKQFAPVIAPAGDDAPLVSEAARQPGPVSPPEG